MTQPITSFDKPTLRDLRVSIDAALEGVAAFYGLRIRVGNARFTETTADFKLELVIDRPVDGTTVPESKEAVAFRRLARAYGFQPTDLGATLQLDGTAYRIVGLRPAAPRRPILLARVDDPTRRVVCSPDTVLLALRRAA